MTVVSGLFVKSSSIFYILFTYSSIIEASIFKFHTFDLVAMGVKVEDVWGLLFHGAAAISKEGIAVSADLQYGCFFFDLLLLCYVLGAFVVKFNVARG